MDSCEFSSDWSNLLSPYPAPVSNQKSRTCRVMALSLSPNLPVKPPPYSPSSRAAQPNLSLRLKLPLGWFNAAANARIKDGGVFRRKAVEKSQEESAEPEAEAETSASESNSNIGEEIKKAMMERKKKEEKGEGDLWSGVGEEIGEIEWPAFPKVLGTTGVVLGVIAGSTVVLLTVNAVLAELSDKFFAGRGIQDFL